MTNYIPALIPLYKRTHLVGYAIVDPEDAPKLLGASWTLAKAGYAVCTSRTAFDGETFMHRVIAQVGGGQVVDHVNGVRTDNRRENLRGCTQAENCRNTRRIRNASGVRGAFLDKRDNRWTSEIRVNGRSYGLGRYGSAEEAGRVYDSAARQLHGEFAVLNWPDDSDAYPQVNWLEYAESRLTTGKNKKLSLEKARAIRLAYADGTTPQELAEKFNVSSAGIYNIIQNRSYKEPPTHPQVEEIYARLELGQTIRRVCRETGIGFTVIARLAKDRYGEYLPERITKRRANAKLTHENVQDILERVKAGELQKDLAKEYNVSLPTINGYVTGRSRTRW